MAPAASNDPASVRVLIYLLGVATGLVGLMANSAASVSSRLMRRIVWALAGLVALRYVAAVLLPAAFDNDARAWSVVWHLWLTGWLALTFPAVAAIDQLVRHPAVTPQRLLRSYAPFAALYLAGALLGRLGDRHRSFDSGIIAWPSVASVALPLAHAAFVGVLAWVAVQLMRKLPDRKTRLALAVLVATYGFWAVVTGLMVFGPGGHLFHAIYAELPVLLALWFAFETAKAQTY